MAVVELSVIQDSIQKWELSGLSINGQSSLPKWNMCGFQNPQGVH